MKALCPSCSEEFELPPTGEWAVCPNCGARTRSMLPDLASSPNPLMRGMAERSAAQCRPPQRLQPPPGPYGPPQQPYAPPQQPVPGAPPFPPPQPYPPQQPFTSQQPLPQQYPYPPGSGPSVPLPPPGAPVQPPPPPTPPPPYPQAWPPPGWGQGGPSPPYPMQQQPDAMTELIAAGKRIGHLVSLVGVLTVAAVVLVCAAVLVWSYLPVHEAATWDLGEGVLFLILPYPLGDSQWTGAGAIGLGAVLLAMGLLLLWVAYDGRFRGLSGFGTSFLGLVTVASGIGFLAWGGWLGSQGHLTAAVTAANWLPVPVGFLELRNWELAQWHAVLIGAILMSLAVLAIKDGPPMLRALRDASRTGALPGMRTDNGWIIIFRVYLGMLFFYLVYYAILGLFQVSTNVPAFEDEPVWSQLYTFANASVWEEILSRTLMLGLPLLLYYRFARRPRPVPRHRFLIGGGIPIDTAAFALVVFSGTVFALAHVNGWDFWKVLPTAITGFFFGYLFLRLGLWAAIILHFTFDYIDVSSQVLGAGVANALGLVQLLWIFAGLILCVHYVVVLYQSGPGEVRRALGRVAPVPASVAAASTVAPPAATPPVVAPPAAAAPTAGVGEGGPGAGGASGPPPAGPGPGPG